MAKRSLYTRGEVRPCFSTDKDALQVEPTPSHWFHCSGSTGPKRSNLRLWEARAQGSWQQPPIMLWTSSPCSIIQRGHCRAGGFCGEQHGGKRTLSN